MLAVLWFLAGVLVIFGALVQRKTAAAMRKQLALIEATRLELFREELAREAAEMARSRSEGERAAAFESRVARQSVLADESRAWRNFRFWLAEGAPPAVAGDPYALAMWLRGKLAEAEPAPAAPGGAASAQPGIKAID